MRQSIHVFPSAIGCLFSLEESFFVSPLTSSFSPYLFLSRATSSLPAFLYSDEFSFGYPLPTLPPAQWLPLGAAHACVDAQHIDDAWRDYDLPTAGAAGALATTTAAAAQALTKALGLSWQEYDYCLSTL